MGNKRENSVRCCDAVHDKYFIRCGNEQNVRNEQTNLKFHNNSIIVSSKEETTKRNELEYIYHAIHTKIDSSSRYYNM